MATIALINVKFDICTNKLSLKFMKKIKHDFIIKANRKIEFITLAKGNLSNLQ